MTDEQLNEAEVPDLSRLRARWITMRYKRTPKLQLRGLLPNLDGLYDGGWLSGIAAWRNQFLDARPILEQRGHYRRIDELLPDIAASMSPENRKALMVVARHRAPFGPLADAACGLAYGLAHTFLVAAGDDPMPPVRVSADDIEEAAMPYSILADYHGYVQTPGYWARYELEDITWKWAIAALRWSHGNQVSRWEKAVGVEMGEGIGFGDLEAGLLQRFPDVLFEHGGRLVGAEYVALRR